MEKKINLNDRVPFEKRHNGPTDEQITEMLQTVDVDSLDQLIGEAIPEAIRLKEDLHLPEELNEYQYLHRICEIAEHNQVFHSFIGQGYYNCVVPTVIQRNIFENPGWYTAYTPYQAEIAQGRLEALINFQTMVMELTSMEVANASLLDEGTAAAEAMSMLHGVRKGARKKAEVFLADERLFPQTLEVLTMRANSAGIPLEIVPLNEGQLQREDVYGVLFQYPDNHGSVKDWSAFVDEAQSQGIFTACATDLLSLCLLKPPGEWGVDVVLGTAQRFGVPLGNGGPHAAFFATRETYKRFVPGRIIGASVDVDGQPALRMALQTREQHIRREKATSNICTAQVLLAVMSAMYAVYHGPAGLKRIAGRVHGMAKSVSNALREMGLTPAEALFFDTLSYEMAPEELIIFRKLAEEKNINFRYQEGRIGISFDETHTPDLAQLVVDLFAAWLKRPSVSIAHEIPIALPNNLTRTTGFLDHEVFQRYHSEHELLRYIKRLESKDLSLVHSMISLGSCTMKLNATTEMIPVSWEEFGAIHPYAPEEQKVGYHALIDELHEWLCAITGFHALSFQPNSGAQGEFTGLAVIKAYLEHKGEKDRKVALIPTSAHGTNPASAVMAGMKVVLVNCDEKGNIDLDDLKSKVAENSESLAVLMVTYPSTHGVFEEDIQTICQLIHDNGGQVYMDGANMNAQVGLTSPAIIGADVCHLNLHKTFCIPHGGGGPGMGPIGVADHLTPFLPGALSTRAETNIHMVSSAPYGSASILPISHAYIAMMGANGLKRATELAILNANYIQRRLQDHYPVLYTNEKGRNAHEFIIDCRGFKEFNIEAEDIAKRLMDYGYHAPTMSFPVPGTMMIEPTESETKQELDRFCDAMIGIRKEIQEVINGMADRQDNVLKHAPHTAKMVLSEVWNLPYSREKAVYPAEFVRDNKFWPSVRRVDNVYGDRNLVCSCLPLEAYAAASTVEDAKA